jgi:hypothetical protein
VERAPHDGVTATPDVERTHGCWYLHLDCVPTSVSTRPRPVRARRAPRTARMQEWLAARRRRRGGSSRCARRALRAAKEWPAAHWAALVDLLAARDVESVLVGAPSERARCLEVAAACRAGALVAAGETSVGELVALLALADAFAGNDSGAMHVAGALGRPTVGIFGSTSPERTSPLGERARCSADRIECSPCLPARTCPSGTTTACPHRAGGGGGGAGSWARSRRTHARRKPAPTRRPSAFHHGEAARRRGLPGRSPLSRPILRIAISSRRASGSLARAAWIRGRLARGEVHARRRKSRCIDPRHGECFAGSQHAGHRHGRR